MCRPKIILSSTARNDTLKRTLQSVEGVQRNGGNAHRCAESREASSSGLPIILPTHPFEFLITVKKNNYKIKVLFASFAEVDTAVLLSVSGVNIDTLLPK